MVEITPYQRRLVAEVPGAGGRMAGTAIVTAAASGSANDGKYYIYSSKSGQQPSGTAHILSPTAENIDDYLSLLPDGGITLAAKPSGTSAVLDAGDKWATWFTNWDESGEISVTYDNATDLNIASFEFRLKAPWDITFSSSDDALKFAFGPGPTGASRVPRPGMPDDGTPLYLGLDPTATASDPKSTVADLFAFAGLGSLGNSLPIPGLGLLKTTLRRNSAAERRNALWLSPEQQLKTTMRLEFDLDEATVLEDALTSVLPGLAFQGFAIAARKAMVLGNTSNGKEAIPVGDVEFEVRCSVNSVDMLLGLGITEYSLDLTFKTLADNAFAGIIGWVISLLPGDGGADSIEGILNNLFRNHIFLRRLTVSVDMSQPKPSLGGLRVDLEVAGSFGQGSNQDRRPTFLVFYNWTAEMGGMGSINGDFWTCFDVDGRRVLDPDYRAAKDMQPFTKTPATEIDLVTLIPGQTVDNVPANVPTKITAAGLYLSQTQFSFKTTLQSRDSVAAEQASTVPQIDLGRIALAAEFDWGKENDFKLHLAIMSILTPRTTSKHQASAILTGSLDYRSADKTWELHASLQNLYASTIWEFFDKGSVDHVIPLIDSLEIDHLTLEYKYTGNQTSPELKGKSVGTYFRFDGLILVADLALQLDFHFQNEHGWEFTASLKAEDKEATIGSILEDMLGDDSLDLPSFLADTTINGSNNEGGIHLAVEKTKGKEPGFQSMSSIQIGDLALTLAQMHLDRWDPESPPKRLVKFSLVGLPKVDLPLIGEFAQPFDEMYLMWVQDRTGLNKANPGLTREEVTELNKTLSLTGHPLVPRDKSRKPELTDVLIAAGSHFAIVRKDQQGERTCVLDYDFKQSNPPQPPPKKTDKALTLTFGEDAEPRPAQDSDGNSSSAPFKKKAGPLQLSNVGLKYADNILHVQFTATFELGPLAFRLIGFRLNVKITSLRVDGLEMLLPTLEGLAASFEKPPLTMAGLIRRGQSDDGLDYYAGGIILGWVPYQLQAAGFYGEALPEGGQKPKDIFRSIFVFARLDGPLVTLEFAEISGVTGGFGYKSEVRVPTADRVVDFPFVKSTSLAGATESAIATLERITSPAADGWFEPHDDTYWAAAGMKIDAFQMISLDAVAVVQFGQSIKMGLFAVALADIPTSASKIKFAHVELGIAVVVDLDYGTFKAEAQLSPNGYILDPNCHLTGGFALWYWFDAPHADRSLIGDFVFTLGGYHQAFDVPDGYPNPPRLGIGWSLGSSLSITGHAYFAITPKACMGGGRLHAAFHAGPIEAWFDAFADFLINYKPFQFLAEAAISVGVRFNLDIWFTHIHIAVEVGADLTLWGPPMAGRVHVDIKVAKFNINFGGGSGDRPPANLLQFYHLVLQASSKTRSEKTPSRALAAPGFSPRVVESGTDEAGAGDDDGDDDPPQKNEGHTFLAQSGLMNDTDKPERSQNQTWTVRGGTFSFVVGCKIAIAKAEQVDDQGNPIDNLNAVVEYTDRTIHARPMCLTTEQILDSAVKISIAEVDSHDPPKAWPMQKFVKAVPTGLWAEYDKSLDPKQSGNNIGQLLDTSGGGVPLMMGVLLMAPPPFMSADKLQAFQILDADRQDLDGKKQFPVVVPASGDWLGVTPSPDQEPAAQWEAVRTAWETPDWDPASTSGPVAAEGGGVQTSFVASWAKAFGWDGALAAMAKMPSLLDKRFDNLYVAAPLLTN
ncbi:hypothetical protein BT67DRAFT_440170 [Trichocladium antarcticum]|uniref:DUF6603 domain-containing protein n=1 Tax=Trichocladium antarcticum TaxID=1450529 RepID=A0AAN6UNH4_9PEZI|nr:hypothetical protein BT67DRAFT_440170 [Trichocladium antarcticum]